MVKGLIEIAVEAVKARSDVHVHHVALHEGPRVGDAVADDLIDRGAHGLREVVVVEGGGVPAAFRDRLSERSQPVAPSLSRTVTQSHRQSAAPSANRTVSQSHGQPFAQSVTQSASRVVSQSHSQQAAQSARRAQSATSRFPENSERSLSVPTTLDESVIIRVTHRCTAGHMYADASLEEREVRTSLEGREVRTSLEERE
eukprot:1191320-Prorocentrum_minimum.AAC.1